MLKPPQFHGCWNGTDPDSASVLTCFCDLHQLIVAEFVEVLLYLRNGLVHRTEGEVGIYGDRRQLLSLCLGYQHVITLKTKNQYDF